MGDYPVRHMADGTATTRKVHDVVKVECGNAYHVHCYEPVTSWAGDQVPRQDNRWHIHEDRSGVVHVSGDLAARESAQFLTGLRRRVRNKQGKSEGRG